MSGLGIKHKVTSMEHPQTNEQVEAANKVILGKLKNLLDGANERWAKELAEVLWVYRPLVYNSGNPFWITYEMDIILPLSVLKFLL